MKRIAFALPLVVVLSIVLFGIVLFPVLCSADVVINEILPSPSIDWNGDSVYNYRDDEWVEIYNNSESPAVLDGYRIADADTTWRYGLSGTIPAQGHLAVYGSQSYAWERANGYPAYGLSLANTGDTVRLWRFVGADSFQVDSYTYGKAAGGSNRSVGRKPSGSQDWYIFDALSPYSGTEPPLGTKCPPSPGGPNGCATDIVPEPWGAIKALFR
ncbi:MAG: lamin tail domain-containing protein [Candidatus Eisenbacteria bacterium]|nr:lamin tail domain-containing protein [Candidatus Eisenbacteria bacterium]